MINKTFIIIILFSTFGLIKLYAQDSEIDSLENLITIHTQDDTVKVNLLNKITYKLYPDDNDKALEYAEEAGKLADKLSYLKGTAESLQQTGEFYFYNSDYPQALDYYLKALQIYKKTNDKHSISRCLNYIGIAYRKQGDYLKALDYYQQALTIKKEINDKNGISNCLNNIGIIYDDQGNYPKALDYYQKSLKIDEELGDKEGISSSLNNIGIIYKSQEDYIKALEYYEKSLKIYKELDDKTGISMSFNNISIVYEVLKDYPKALEYQRKSLKIDEELNDKIGISVGLNNIGEIFIKQGNYLQALENFNKALKIKEKIGDKLGLCETYFNIGTVYLKTENFTKALSFTEKSLVIAKELKLLNEHKDIRKQLSEIYSFTKNYKKAFENYKLYKVLNDSIFNKENIKKITKLEYKNEFEKEKQVIELEQQKKDAVAAIELKQQKTIRNSFITGFILMIIIVFIVLRGLIQKKKANQILREQKQIIEESHKNIKDSINYASRIQQALLPTENFFSENFSSHFILYKPKDIVSGDFYYFKKIENYIIVAVADCTGHGVPGAFVSMLGIAFLNEIVRKKEIKSASQVLEELRNQVKTTLKENTNKDGMDIALCVINTETKKLQFSGANNPLYLFRNKELIEVKATRNPIGVYFKDEEAFKNNEIQLKNNDTIYMFTDGYTDQFGGSEGQKFMFKRFHKLLKSVQNKPLNKQKEILNRALEDWKGNDYNQIDDILILGLKI